MSPAARAFGDDLRSGRLLWRPEPWASQASVRLAECDLSGKQPAIARFFRPPASLRRITRARRLQVVAIALGHCRRTIVEVCVIAG
jgi:hypothetical protein